MCALCEARAVWPIRMHDTKHPSCDETQRYLLGARKASEHRIQSRLVIRDLDWQMMNEINQRREDKNSILK